MDVLTVIFDYLKAQNWIAEKETVEYEAVGRLAEFLLKTAEMNTMVSKQDSKQHIEGKARLWARTAFRSAAVILNEKKFVVHTEYREVLERARFSAGSAVAVFVSKAESPAFFKEHSSAVFEVPGFSKLLVHWFYKSQELGANPKLTEVFQQTIGSLLQSQRSSQIPKHHGKSLLKLLKANTACENCHQKDPTTPMLAACVYCKQAFYCNKVCSQEHWDSTHSRNCKHKWKAEVTNTR
jgi:hypothetical protein